MSSTDAVGTAASPLEKYATSRLVGVVRVLEGEDLALAALSDQSELWNRLTMAEGAFIKRYRKILHDFSPELGRLDEEMLALRKGLAGDQSQAANLVGRLRDVTAAAALLRKSAIPRCRTEIKELDEAHLLTLRGMAAESGLWWQHAESVLGRFRVARLEARRSGEYLWPKRFQGEGSLSMRFTHGGAKNIDWAGFLEGGSGQAQLTPANEEVLGARMKAEKADGGRRMILTAAIGATDSSRRHPTVRMLVTLHRAMPENIRLIGLTLRRTASVSGLGKGQWSASFTFSGSRVHPPSRSGALPCAMVDLVSPDIDGPTQGVDPTERAATSGILVASIRIGDRQSAVELPPSWVRIARKASAAHAAGRDAVADLDTKVRSHVAVHPHLIEDPLVGSVLTAITTGPTSARTLLGFATDLAKTVLVFGAEEGAGFVVEAVRVMRMLEGAAALSSRAHQQRMHLFRNQAAAVARTCSVVQLRCRPASARAGHVGKSEKNGNQISKWACRSTFQQCLMHACEREGTPIQYLALE